MKNTRHRHVSLWPWIKGRLRRNIELRKVPTLDAQNLSDRGLGRQVTDAMASTSARVMAHRIGVDPFDISTDTWLGDDIIRECTQCTQRGTCRLWLADPDADDDGYKEFCPNVERFQKLM